MAKYHNHTRSSNPKEFGPGTWDTLHILGKHANTFDKKLHYIETTDVICKELGCSKCSKDSLEYKKDHPLLEYWNIKRNGQDVGFFYWSVDFHNYVNRKLGKPEIPREVAYKMYYKSSEGEEICKGDCSEPTIIPPVSRFTRSRKEYGYVPSK